jgi:demethoxyubiquinone hydroxylase (CLK1/Coq7/Cat5 family)
MEHHQKIDRRIIRTLRKLFNLEVMAVQIYCTQLGAMAGASEREMMLAAMENEILHRETFRSLLSVRGASPSILWPLYWLAGQTLGRVTSFFGRTAVLKADILFEDRASVEYAHFLEKNGFNEDETAFLKSFLADEKRHSANWRALLDPAR